MKTVGEKQLTKRYGKWRQMLKNDANLRDSLESVGVRGLKEFGYEPLRPLAKSGARVQGKASCDWSAMKECPGMLPQKEASSTSGGGLIMPIEPLTSWSASGAYNLPTHHHPLQ